ncbi:MAG: hypothetical protein ABFD97_19710 [Syntrophobacter sp.]
MADAAAIMPYDNFRKIMPNKEFCPDLFTGKQMRFPEQIPRTSRGASVELGVEAARPPNEPRHKT